MVRDTVKLTSVLTILLLAALAVPLSAVADDDDPPARVARLAFTQGSVSFQPAGTDDWVSAVVNRPLTTGDKIWTDRDSRAEMHIGSASIRIGAMTGFSFLNLNDNITQIRLTEGVLRLRVKRLDENETLEVDTPNLAFSVLRPGVYRINVNENGDTTVIKIRSGDGEVTGGGSAYNLHPWEKGVFRGQDQLSAEIEGDRDDDNFDRWCADRDRHEDLAVSARFVSPDVIGYEDLDDYGGWRPVPEHGMVWFPHTTIIGWAPYRYGHWAYVAPWGYTWIDDAPWGFAPFHYGRWVNVNGAWGWVPCPPPPPPGPRVVYVRPVYAPALVAWVGGPHFGVGISVGWFPLAPREVYVPSYHVSRNYVNNVNVSNTTVNTTVVNNYYNNTVINNTNVVNNNVTVVKYMNQQVPGAVTATSHQAFTSAQPVGKNIVVLNQRDASIAPVNVTAPSGAPARQSVLGSAVAARPPEASVNRAVVAKVPPPPPPVSFARQQQAIQSNGGRPPAISQIQQVQPVNQQTQHPLVRVAPTVATPNAGRPQPPPPVDNRPGTVNNAVPANNGNRPANPPVSGRDAATGNRPPFAQPAGTPRAPNPTGVVNTTVPPGVGNKPPNPPGNARDTGGSNRPPSAPPVGNPNTSLDLKHQQELEQLRQRQDQERQKAERHQFEERQKQQNQANAEKERQLNEKHQQQLEQLEKKHDQEQQKLQQKHEQERHEKGKPEGPGKPQ
ncbi:MAG TPA: DUF6600 domain-containing protein [Candidatus Saccharimonadales bacterium]|jgi:hypothetical protein|nr:DUF6600 domain-containing protein [Candidatus Saccharimonadales bacterium]